MSAHSVKHKQGLDEEREREERGEAPKLFRRRSAHRSLSQCKVKARVEITVKTSRTQNTSCGQPRWGCAGCRGKFEWRREQKMLLRSESDRNGGWAHYALFLWEIKISMQGVRTWAAWAKRIFLSGAQWSHHCGILFPGKHAVLALLNKPFLFKPPVLSLLFMLETNTKVHKLSLTPVFPRMWFPHLTTVMLFVNATWLRHIELNRTWGDHELRVSRKFGAC